MCALSPLCGAVHNLWETQPHCDRCCACTDCEFAAVRLVQYTIRSKGCVGLPLELFFCQICWSCFNFNQVCSKSRLNPRKSDRISMFFIICAEHFGNMFIEFIVSMVMSIRESRETLTIRIGSTGLSWCIRASWFEGARACMRTVCSCALPAQIVRSSFFRQRPCYRRRL